MEEEEGNFKKEVPSPEADVLPNPGSKDTAPHCLLTEDKKTPRVWVGKEENNTFEQIINLCSSVKLHFQSLCQLLFLLQSSLSSPDVGITPTDNC